MPDEHTELAAYFDGWYADMVGTERKDEIQRRHLGLPPDLLSTSLLTWDGIAEVVDELALSPGSHLVDLACGRGGYGLETAARTGARLTGIDFSAVALDAARCLAEYRGQAADFQLGDLVATGLPDACADGVLVVDAIQFPGDPAAAYAEIHRVLKPGGRVVLTCWEPVDRTHPDVPLRLRQVDLAGGLSHAGFVDVVARERPAWQAAETAMWAEAAGLEPGDDPALRSFHEEGVRAQAMAGLNRRVLASATRG